MNLGGGETPSQCSAGHGAVGSLIDSPCGLVHAGEAHLHARADVAGMVFFETGDRKELLETAWELAEKHAACV